MRIRDRFYMIYYDLFVSKDLRHTPKQLMSLSLAIGSIIGGLIMFLNGWNPYDFIINLIRNPFEAVQSYEPYMATAWAFVISSGCFWESRWILKEFASRIWRNLILRWLIFTIVNYIGRRLLETLESLFHQFGYIKSFKTI